jgi:hypothetical protein
MDNYLKITMGDFSLQMKFHAEAVGQDRSRLTEATIQRI